MGSPVMGFSARPKAAGQNRSARHLMHLQATREHRALSVAEASLAYTPANGGRLTHSVCVEALSWGYSDESAANCISNPRGGVGSLIPIWNTLEFWP